MAVVDTPAAAAAGGRARRAGGGAATGAIFRIDADGASDTIWESRDDTPYDVAPLDERRAARGHRPPRQALSARRRSRCAPRCSAACPASRPCSCCASAGAHAGRDVERRRARARRRRRTPTAAPTSRTCATPARVATLGHARVARHDAGRGAASRSRRAPATPPRPTRRWSAWSAGLHERRGRRRSPVRPRATCSGASCSSARTRARS